ncbi:MAG: class I SAM-dependent methyltransferase [Asgard group archaeon]|nr:class I SAM-dependent methyltransferase [Asgard group archaeon]
MKKSEKYYEDIRKMWDENTKINFESDMYQTEEFLKGKTTLNSIELEELGKRVKGKSLLHLQCHFGLDTLSWAREGAKVTGVDISGESIRLARKLAEEANIDATFIQSNIYDLPEALDEKFDIVFTSYGVLCWLNDIKRWAEVIAHFLKPGGIFYIAEFHRFIWVFDWDAKDDFVVKNNYFHDPKPISYTLDGSYADDNKKFETQEGHEWAHSLSDVINSLINAGLEIQFLNEYPVAPFPRFSFLKKSDDGYWRYNHPEIQLPLVFSLMAIKK